MDQQGDTAQEVGETLGSACKDIEVVRVELSTVLLFDNILSINTKALLARGQSFSISS